MANSDKNIVITPNIGSTTADPKIVFSGADASNGPQNITLQVYPTNSGTLSFEGSAGQLFSITNSLSGTIYSVNDVSGIPSIEVLDTGLVKLAQYSGNVVIGSGTDTGLAKLQLTGSLSVTGNVINSTNSKTIYGPNTTWGSYLHVGGDSINGITRTSTLASVVTSNGNVHIDAGSDKATYINYYSGTGGIYFGNGTTGYSASVSAGGAFTGTNFIGPGTGLTGTATSLSIGGNAATATSATTASNTTGYSKYITFDDGPRDLSNRLPNSYTRAVLWDFVGAGTANGSGNYGGVMTFAPWIGTTASTGDSSYQLAFANTTGANASGQPKLSIRNGIDTTWNAWYTVLHSGNWSSFVTSYVTGVTGTAPIVSSGGTAPVISISAATTLAAGSMSAADKTKLDGIASGATANTGTVTSVGISAPALFTVTNSPVTSSGTLTLSYSGTALPVANGGTAATTAAGARTNLGATTVGSNLFTLTNPTAVTFPRFNADNTVSTLDAATFRTAIGAGTSSTTGTVTSVGGTGTVSGLTLTGTVTSTGNLTLGGTLAVTAANFASQTANTFLSAPNGTAGVPTFRAIVAADIPTLNQNTTGTAANVTGTVAIANGGTAATTAAGARTNIGATTVGSNLFTLTNPTAIAFLRVNADNTVSTLDAATFRTAIGAGTSSTAGTVTSVATSGTVSGLTLTGGTITTTGTITLGGTLAVTASNFASQTANTFLSAPNGTAGVPTFRAIVAADIPTLNQNTTGNAATATSASNIDGVAFNNSNSTNPVSVPDSLDSNGVGYVTNVSLLGQNDGALYSQAYSSLWQHHIFGDYRTGQMAIRGKNSGTWQAWRTVLDSTNWSSYVTAGATITDDTTTNATRYLLFDDVTSGTASSVGVSSTKLYYNPSTGTLNATNFNSLSDTRLKHNIEQLDKVDALAIIDQLNPVSFQWLGNDQKAYGVIAQEIEKILPEVVETNTDNDIKSVSYMQLVPILIQAIKQLTEQVEQLKAGNR